MMMVHALTERRRLALVGEARHRADAERRYARRGARSRARGPRRARPVAVYAGSTTTFVLTGVRA